VTLAAATTFLAWLTAQDARDVSLSDRPIEVRVPVAGDADHRATVVTFPETSIEALVAGWNEGDLSIERRRENLFLKLLRRAEGDVHVLGSSGSLYRLAVKPVEGIYDGHVRIRRPDAEKKRGEPDPLRLIRAMRLGRRPDEGQVRSAQGMLYRSSDIEVAAAYVYEMPTYRGFVVQATNLLPVPLRLDPSRFVGRDLVLAGMRDLEIPPAGKTRIYLVFWKGP
jgi:hypothetical protein